MADTTPPAPAADANNTAPAATPPAGTPAATGSTANTTATASVDPNAEVCKRMAPETGTRIGSRMVCKTNAQWEAEMRNTQQTDRGLQNHMTGYTGTSTNGR